MPLSMPFKWAYHCHVVSFFEARSKMQLWLVLLLFVVNVFLAKSSRIVVKLLEMGTLLAS